MDISRVTLIDMMTWSWSSTIFLLQAITQYPSFPLMDLLWEMVKYVQDLAPSGHFSDLVHLASPEPVESYEVLLHKVVKDLFRKLRCMFPDAGDELRPMPGLIQAGEEEAPNFMILEFVVDTLKTLRFGSGQPVPYYKRAHTQVNTFLNTFHTILSRFYYALCHWLIDAWEYFTYVIFRLVFLIDGWSAPGEIAPRRMSFTASPIYRHCRDLITVHVRGKSHEP